MRVFNGLLTGLASLVAGSSTSDEQDLTHLPIFSVTGKVASALPTDKTFAAAAVDTAADTATITAHGFATGLKVQVSNPGTLPTGIAAATDYYIIVVDDDTVQFATSQANALAGTAVDITAAGSGTNTVEVDTDIAGSWKLQLCNDPESWPDTDKTWVDVPDSTTNFTGSDADALNYSSHGYRAIRAVVTVTSGAVTAAIRINAKGA